jgi:DNA-binding transcriptional ArsR family regulator
MGARVASKPRTRRAALPDASAQLHPHADEAVAVLKALASRNRLLLLCELVSGERSVGGPAQSLDLAQATVSQHLSLLRRDGVVSGRREAQTIHYRISDPRAQALMATLFQQFCVDG